MKTPITKTPAINFVLAVFLLGVGSLNVAPAQGVIFTDRSAFNAAIGSTISFDFESLPISGSDTNRIAVSPYLNFITGNQLNVYPQSFSSPGVPSSSGKYVGTFDGSMPMTITGPTTRNAFGADFSGSLAVNFTGTLTFNLSDGSSASFQFPGISAGWTFFGVVLSKNISSVIFDDGGQVSLPSHQERIDNITYGVAVPEPDVAALLLLGGFSCNLLRRKKYHV